MINKKIYRSTVLSVMILAINMQGMRAPSPAPAPYPSIPNGAPSTPGTPKDITTFLFTVATGVTIVLVGKACEYAMNVASGNQSLREQELKVQQERVTQQHMALIHEFCKDDVYRDACQKLKQHYLESQMAMNKTHSNG